MNKQTISNAINVLKNDGISGFAKRTVVHVKFMHQVRKQKNIHNFKDILFINGCPIDYCERYRVHHKMQELIAYGYTVDEVLSSELNEEIIKFYRAFVIYRMPYDQNVDNFIKKVHENNKIVFYDIDDLVFDLKYTKNLESLKSLTKEQLSEYNDGVVRYGKLLDLCDYGITTTTVIANEMKKHVKDVCIDKNIASVEMQKYSEDALKNKTVEKNDKIVIGYSSGSFTHNSDFEMISKQIIDLMKKYNNVELLLIGALNVPDCFMEFGDRVKTHGFVDYTKLPELLASLDINLAPLVDNFFDSAKSNIKWMEAALVKVPTVASDVGNFHDSIKDGYDGVLCSDSEWFEKLEKLVTNFEYRKQIGENAYNTIYSSYTPIASGKQIADFIGSKLTKNICFIIPSTNISGGNLVTLHHALVLKKHGYDVTLINTDEFTADKTILYSGDNYVYVVSTFRNNIDVKIDVLVATMWFTLLKALDYHKCYNIKYLVQSRESGFYEKDNYDNLLANSTYYNHDNVNYLTISKWCNKWLREDFDVNSRFIPNGIDLSKFPYKKRKFTGKIKILIEGDSKSEYKNVDESFKITNSLDHNKYEIHYLSYNGKSKKWYYVDEFYNKIPHDDVYKIYQDADILLKSSILESFSYPPIEMMATGGVCVVLQNEGNTEYLVDNYNCLFYKKGNIDDAIEKIELIVHDNKLREKIIKNGLNTASSRDWNKIENDILEAYKK